MIATDKARTEIMRAIRDNLARSRDGGESPASHHAKPNKVGLPILSANASAPRETRPDLLAGFRERLEAVGGHCVVVDGEVQAAQTVDRILADSGATRVVASDAPLVLRLLQGVRDRVDVRDARDISRAELFACDAGVTSAQWAIAETGTLVLESARELHRLCSLVPRLHIAVLPASCICATLGDALERVRDSASHAITFITGPSRTSDIELTLVIGVHGPQALHVIVIHDNSQLEI